MDVGIVLLLVAGLLVGIGIGATMTRSHTRAALVQERADAQTALARLRAEMDATVAVADAQRDAAINRLEELQDDRESLINQFTVLADQTLQEQSRRADAAAEHRLKYTEALMTPVKETLTALNTQLAKAETQRSAHAAELGEQVRQVVASGELLRRETSALSTALRKPQVRGAWGELQLRRVVEIAGMLDHCDFFEQASGVTSADTRIRPDMQVMLGGGKFVYVDSKVPLSAFLDAQEARSETERQTRLKQFGENVKSHVDQLSAKQYWKSDTGSPEFVVLFIPSEALGAEALAQRADLHEYSAARNIIIATPTTLIGLLRAVAYGWKQAALADSAAEVFALGRELYDRLVTMGGAFAKLGRSLQQAVNHFNSTVGSLETRVLVSARRFRDLQITEKDLASAHGIEQSARPLTAPELVANADGQAPASIPKTRLTQISESDDLAMTESELLGRATPTIAELVDTDTPLGETALPDLGEISS